MAPLHRRPALLLTALALAASGRAFAPVPSTPPGRAPPLRMAGEDELRHGRVKFYDSTRGFGFLVPDGGSGTRKDDVFAHQSHIQMDGFRHLRAKQRVRFRASTREDGKVYATDIRVVDEVVEAEGGEAEGVSVLEVAGKVASHLEEIAPPEEISLTLEEEKEEVKKVEATVPAVAEKKDATPDPFAGLKSLFGF